MPRSRGDLVHAAMLLCALSLTSAFGLIGGAAAQLAPRSMLAPPVEPARHTFLERHASLERPLKPTLATAVRSLEWNAATANLAAAAAEHRSPLVAGFLGILPGVGHVYAGEGRRGLTIAAIWLGSGMVMFSDGDKSIVAVAAVVNIGTYVFSIADAALAAERFNSRHRE